jgi:hypothetical protein
MTTAIAVALVGSLSIVVAQGQGSTTAQGLAGAPAHPPPFTMSGDIALWTVAVKPDKTADFERVLAKLRSALSHSSDPVRRQQAAGWKVMKIDKPMPDGNIAYVHVISPVVKGADYAVLQTLYDELPDERQELYTLYRGAFAQNLALSAGSIVMDAGTAVATQ